MKHYAVDVVGVECPGNLASNNNVNGETSSRLECSAISLRKDAKIKTCSIPTMKSNIWCTIC